MASVNKVVLVGRLGKDPEIRYTPDGGAVASFSLATSQKWKDKNTGEAKEETEWHRVVIFGKLSEIVQKYVFKGSLIYIEGRLKTRKWQDQSGVDRYTTEVIADQMQMLGEKADARQESTGQVNQGYVQPKTERRPAQPQDVQNMDDDIPF